MLTFLVFLLVLSVLVLVHELGHFLAAKKAGIKVEEFGFGYPPRVWSRKRGETVYSINAIPFGGFVKLHGEELEEFGQDGENKRAFWAKSKRARTGVIVAGVIGNYILGTVCFATVYSVMGIPTKTDQVRILAVAQNSPAEEKGLKENDLVLAVDQTVVENLDHFVETIEEKKGEEVQLLLERDTQELTVEITPREMPPEGEGALGVLISDVEPIKYPFWQMPFRGIVYGFKEALAWGGMIFSSLGKMLADLVGRGVVPRDVAGPIGIFQATAGAAQRGALSVFQFVGILSVNLAVINILPFPALDGGKLAFVVYEAITKRRPKPSIERWVNALGMVVLVTLLILVTLNDISRLFETSAIFSRLRPLWPF